MPRAITNVLNEDGNTPLHLAIQENNDRMVKILLDHGAQWDIPNRIGDTAWGLSLADETSVTMRLLHKMERRAIKQAVPSVPAPSRPKQRL